MNETDIAKLLERSVNTQNDVLDIKKQLTNLADKWDENLKALDCRHNKLNNRVTALIGVLAGLGALGGGAAGVLKLLGY